MGRPESPAPSRNALHHVLARERFATLAVLFIVAAAAWVYLLLGAGMDMDHAGMSLTEPMAMPWSASIAAVMVVMWLVMMAAMMLPTAAPMILLFDTMARRRQRRRPAAATAVFVCGYLAAWGSYAVGATALQYGLEQALLMSMQMRTTSTILAGAVLVGAGLYQLTPLKQACLRHCRSPLDFVIQHWREGTGGAFVMGWTHGLYCLGCCWVLMALLFVGGVMNLLWIAVITLYVFAEKALPAGHQASWIAGAALIGWGGLTLVSASW